MLVRILVISFFLASCSSSRMIETNLYFAQSKPNGTLITETEWNQFKEKQLFRIFKEGSTIVNVTGQWLDPESHQLITEQTYLVIYLYRNSAEKSRQIDSLISVYKILFQQQSVLRVDKKVKASF